MLAVFFPGQGSQSVGMMKAMSEQYPIVLQRFQEASDIIGKDLWDIAQNNPDDRLNRTKYTQPIILTASLAAYELLQQETGISPAHFAGHSLGEYSALTASGALTFAEAVKLVHHRGKIMQEAVAHGVSSVAAILGLDDKTVAKICGQVNDEVYPANFNSPEQIVIAGKRQAVDEAISIAKESGAKRAVLLPVSVPSHTPLMRTASAKFSLFLDKIHWQVPHTPVTFNVDAKQHLEPYGIIAALGAQLYEPVQWTDSVRAIADIGITKAVEVGPGKVLTGLVKRIDKRINCTHFDTPAALANVRAILEEI